MLNNSSISKTGMSMVLPIALKFAVCCTVSLNNILLFFLKYEGELAFVKACKQDLIKSVPQVFFLLKVECLCSPLTPCTTIKEVIDHIKTGNKFVARYE